MRYEIEFRCEACGAVVQATDRTAAAACDNCGRRYAVEVSIRAEDGETDF